MRTLTLVLSLALSGCAVALSGHESTGGGTSSTSAVATHGQASIGSAKVGASFGTPAPAGSAGGQISVSRGASVVLILGLAIAEVVNYFSAPPDDVSRFALDPRRSIADTCSCYGYRSVSQLTGTTASE
jgi:hypothetical protein